MPGYKGVMVRSVMLITVRYEKIAKTQEAAMHEHQDEMEHQQDPCEWIEYLRCYDNNENANPNGTNGSHLSASSPSSRSPSLFHQHQQECCQGTWKRMQVQHSPSGFPTTISTTTTTTTTRTTMSSPAIGIATTAASTRQRVALITGITGQDGAYLSELLLSKGYLVHGIIRRSSSFNTGRIEHLYRDPHSQDVKLFLHYGDVCDTSSLYQIISSIQPDEIYNLAAMSHVRVSFELSEYTADVDGVGVLRLLNCIRACGLEKKTRFYQASTSELFGKVRETPQNEHTPFYPRSPYGIAKQFAFWSVVNYREAYGMFAVNGILFNHESPRRGPTFVTRKITRAVVRIKAGLENCLYIGNLDAKRDWGHARDYVECMWRMLQRENPEDFVVATGECHSVRELVEIAFQQVAICIHWVGARGSLQETGVDAANPERVLVRVDTKYFRPAEVDVLVGDATKAHKLLDWKPSVSFEALIAEMVQADAQLLKQRQAIATAMDQSSS